MASVGPSDVASDLQGRRAGSPTRSDAASVYSYSSSTHNLTRDIYGRTLNNVNDDNPYVLGTYSGRRRTRQTRSTT
ncbi:hypothetical protein FRC04_009921 [Tulasnella sp. 424]|nr:hypothetical protein FRC04_009921 [Tulasnella sp. 424]